MHHPILASRAVLKRWRSLKPSPPNALGFGFMEKKTGHCVCWHRGKNAFEDDHLSSCCEESVLPTSSFQTDFFHYDREEFLLLPAKMLWKTEKNMVSSSKRKWLMWGLVFATRTPLIFPSL